ncbi:phosphoadenosine phosphosulfate reductase family protein [Nonomuraea wenchangensis]|uniref:phosphoadenosine phosphosulfate reductase domain-containing protein n=1 Tax=Nonomuraea wenchangensis TaxID=568860 RepID=UPI00343E0A26
MLAHLAELVARQRWRGRVVVLYNELGVTAAGRTVEWPGARHLAREHAAVFGFEFVERRRAGGGLIQQLTRERRLWPSSQARWCTSDQKESQAMSWVTEAVEEFWQALGVPADRPVRVLYCLGLRSEESVSRAAQPALQDNARRSSGRRTITRWLPIQDWTLAQVWAQIRRSPLRPHAAYSWGMSRLSCSLCVLASMDDLLLAAALRPQLAADYRQIEIELGHRFTHKLSMGEILAGLHAARLEVAGDPASGDSAATLWQMARDFIAASRARAVFDKGAAPWSAQQVDDRAEAHARAVLASARRALDCLAQVPPEELRELRAADRPAVR